MYGERCLYGARAIARAVAIAAVAAAWLIGPAGGATASADPVIDNGDVLVRVVSANGSHITRTQVVTDENDQQMIVWVYSGSMDREIPIRVQRPHDTSEPRPVLYLLNGAGGGEDGSDWKRQTKAMQFLADKNVNVVTPLAGKFSYYADWVSPDPVLGNYKWQTFLTEELPPIIDAGLGTTGKNALAGLSTSGTTVLALPIAKPGLYESVAAYSGCAQISDPLGYEIVRIGVDVWGGGNADNMYGPPGDPMWAANDPYVQRRETAWPADVHLLRQRFAGQVRRAGRGVHVARCRRVRGPGGARGRDRGGDKCVLAQPEGAVGSARDPGDLQLPADGHAQLGLLGGRPEELLAGAVHPLGIYRLRRQVSDRTVLPSPASSAARRYPRTAG